MKLFPVEQSILLLHNVQQLLVFMGKPQYGWRNDEVSENSRNTVAVSEEMQMAVLNCYQYFRNNGKNMVQ